MALLYGTAVDSGKTGVLSSVGVESMTKRSVW